MTVDQSKLFCRICPVLIIAACLAMVYVVSTKVHSNTIFASRYSQWFSKEQASQFGQNITVQKGVPSTLGDGTPHEGKRRCPIPPPNLIKQIPVDQSNTTIDAVIAAYPEVAPGGRWEPRNCKSSSAVAILVPYRNREEHLKLFLRHMHRFLQKQLLNYTIYIIEQTNGTKFNRGFLFNVGVSNALLERTFDCFIFHDVDLLPENEANLYQCSNKPTHLATGISKWNYKIIYPSNFGGVTMMSRKQFIRSNGFSNRFHGWGGEDDDNRLRILSKGMEIYKTPTNIGRYTSLGHDIAKPNPKRFNLLNTRNSNEGYNTIDYRFLDTEKRPLYTWLLVQPNYVDKRR